MSVEMAINPVADIFPPMGAREFDALCADIRQHGLREPIWLHHDRSVIDGRHRLRACLREGVEPRFRTWDGAGSLVGFVVSLNLHRRHLDESQRAMVGARIAQLPAGNPKLVPIASIEAITTQSDAAKLLNVSRSGIQRAREVLEEGTPELIAAVERGSISVSPAREVTELPPDVQREVVQRVESGEKPADVLRDVRPHVANNSGNNEWYTPPAFIEAARTVMGQIDVDPASSPVANAVVRAATYYTAEDDGLTQPWHGNVWMNPPYAQPLIDQFAAAVSDKYDSGDVQQACVLVNNATETGWFQRMVQSASAVCLVRRRVRFLDPQGNPSGAPLQGQAVLYFGAAPERFAEGFSELGQTLVKP